MVAIQSAVSNTKPSVNLSPSLVHSSVNNNNSERANLQAAVAKPGVMLNSSTSAPRSPTTITEGTPTREAVLERLKRADLLPATKELIEEKLSPNATTDTTQLRAAITPEQGGKLLDLFEQLAKARTREDAKKIIGCYLGAGGNASCVQADSNGEIYKVTIQALQSEMRWVWVQLFGAIAGLLGIKNSPNSDSANLDQVPIVKGPLFEGGPKSLLARVIGIPEGTRTEDGGRTKAFYGHNDPNTGYNKGSFSYQHPARSPEEADMLHLQYLKTLEPKIEAALGKTNFSQRIKEIARFTMYDLGTQAPTALLGDRKSSVNALINRLGDIKEGPNVIHQIVTARVNSYYADANRTEFEGAGVLRTPQAMYKDQERRTLAIIRGLKSLPAGVG